MKNSSRLVFFKISIHSQVDKIKNQIKSFDTKFNAGLQGNSDDLHSNFAKY